MSRNRPVPVFSIMFGLIIVGYMLFGEKNIAIGMIMIFATIMAILIEMYWNSPLAEAFGNALLVSFLGGSVIFITTIESGVSWVVALIFALLAGSAFGSFVVVLIRILQTKPKY